MDRNTIIGFVLIAAVFIGFSIWNRPSEEEIKKQEAMALAEEKKAKEEDSLKAISAQKVLEQKQNAVNDTTMLFYSALSGENKEIILHNKRLSLTLNTKGGIVNNVVVRGFKNKVGGEDVTLFTSNTQSINYSLRTKDGFLSTEDLYFTASDITDTTVTFTAKAMEGREFVIRYKLGNDYLLSTSISAHGLKDVLDPKNTELGINWQERMAQQEQGFTFENRYATLTYHEANGGTDHLSESAEKIDEKIERRLDWIAFKTQFFSTVIIAKDNFASGASLTSIPQEKGSGFLKNYQAKMTANFDPTGQKATEFEFYYGPNDFQVLKSVEKESGFGKNLDLQSLVYLGWPVIREINRWFTLYVFDWLTGMNINMGIVLILITLLLKVITFPLVKKSYLSSAKMRVLKPKLDEATKQFNKPEDQLQKQQAMMSEYAKYGVSPLSGCLPMLIQMPIWIAMFNFVPNAIQLRGESFLWIKDLSTYDPIIEWNNNIWLIGDHLSLTCILFCVANVLYSIMTMRQQRDQMVGQQAEQMKMMQWMMMVMPVMFFFMFNDYAAGLNFYYFVSLLFSAIIMWTLRKTTNDDKLLAKLEANYQETKNNPKKLTGLAARLQQMQEEQQRLKSQREKR